MHTDYPTDPSKINCVFRKINSEAEVYIETTRVILPGEQLFLQYDLEPGDYPKKVKQTAKK